MSEPAGRPPVLDIRGLSRTYRSSGGVRTEALRDVDLRVEHGEFVALMGASGSGKSTLMNIMGLLDRDFTGQFLLDGEDVHGLRDGRASQLRSQHIGFVFQQFNLLPRASVLQNVLLPTTYRRMPDAMARALEVIEAVGLADRIDHRSNQLSGGQMQRVAIARALMMRPSLLLADEPTGNLDSETAQDVLALLAQVHASGSTVVLITHEPEVAVWADRVVHIRDGRVDPAMTATGTRMVRQ